MQSNAAPFVSIIKATVIVEENNKTTPHAIHDLELLTSASAKADFPSHSCIAFSAKVSHKNGVPHLSTGHPPARLDTLFIGDACDAGNVRGLLRSSDTGRLNGLSARMGNTK